MANKEIRRITVLSTIAMILTGCTGSSWAGSSQPQATRTNQKVIVEAVGYDDGNTANEPPRQISLNLGRAVAVIKNSSSTDIAETVNVQFAVLGATGEVLTTGTDAIDVLKPGERMGAMGLISPAGTARVAQVKAQVSASSWMEDPHPEQRVTVSGVTWTRQSDASSADETYLVAGEVHNPYAIELRHIRLMAVCYDASDHIVGGRDGSYSPLAFVPAGSSAAASQSAVLVSRTPARCELFAGLNADSR